MTMDYVRLGRSGVFVSPICLGTMNFGGQTDLKTARRIVGHAREAGINFIDTADQYSAGESEKITGQCIKGERDWWVVATKVAVPFGKSPNDRGVSRRWIIRGLDASLKRLGMDHVDIFYMHRDDRLTPFEESIGAMADLVRAGKIRYWGMSNFDAWRTNEAVNIATRIGAPLPVVNQPCYNAMNRTPEVELLPACQHHGLGVVPYSPLARGVLTGKYQAGKAPPKDTRAGRNDKRMLETEFRTESMAIAEKIKAHAAKRGLTPIQFAMLWTLNNRIVTSVLAGPRTLSHWDAYISCLDLRHRFDESDEAFLDGLVTPGHPSTPGFNDPEYPIRGRPLFTK